MKKILIFSILIALNIQLLGAVKVILKNDIKDKYVTIMSLDDYQLATLSPKSSKEFNSNELTGGISAYVVNSTNLGNIDLDDYLEEAKNKQSDLVITFKKPLLSKYKYSISYKPQLQETPELQLNIVDPKKSLAQKFGVTLSEWNKPSTYFAARFFGLDEEILTFEDLSSAFDSVVASLNKAQESAEAEQIQFQHRTDLAPLFINKLKEIEEMKKFILRAYDKLLELLVKEGKISAKHRETLRYIQEQALL